MYEYEALTRSAKRIRDSIWCNTPGKAALLGARWLKQGEGEQALIAYMEQMRAAEDDAQALLAMQIFQLKVEIGARKAGWCPELPPGPPMGSDDAWLSTDC